MTTDTDSKTTRWQRLRQLIRKSVRREALLNLRYGMLSGVDDAVNYINGYTAAAEGRAQNDFTGGHLQTSNILIVWWQHGWKDYQNGEPMNPYKIAREKYERQVE